MGNYTYFFALAKTLGEGGYQIDRSEMIGLVTGGKKFSLTALSAAEYQVLIEHMKQLTTQLGQASGFGDVAKQRLRRKVISLFRDIGYTAGAKADMRGIYSWMLKFGKYHKPLNAHSREELQGLIGQVSAFARKKHHVTTAH